MFYFYDWTFLLLIPAILATIYAQWKVHRAFRTASKIQNSRGLTGRQVAETILRQQMISGVDIQHGSGFFSDYYHPIKKVLNLSEEVYDKTSIAALGVAAHEVGHAIQHARGYAPLKFRTAMYPATHVASSLAPILFIIGIFATYQPLLHVGIGLFAVSVVFTVVTLPVEFDASARAVKLIQETGMVDTRELGEVKRVLNAAALTYVAAALMAMLELVRLILIARRD